jgi:NAD(P)H dehydrogenase (quinone)
MAEQRFSAELNALPSDVEREIDALLWADLVVLQFPLWWFGMPAILKGWMDRVFVYGRLYTGSRRLDCGVCAKKRAMLSVAAGASADACAHDGQEGDTKLILWPISYALRYLGFTVLEPALITGVRGGFTGKDAVAQGRYLDECLARQRALFADIDAVRAIPFNVADDWDDRRKLRPHAAVHSPFIRHRLEWKTEVVRGSLRVAEPPRNPPVLP